MTYMRFQSIIITLFFLVICFVINRAKTERNNFSTAVFII